jgi:hypothetical protein
MSMVVSVVDSRNSTCGLVPATLVYPNNTRVVNGTTIYDVETSRNSNVPGTDSRTAGSPVDSRAAGQAPQNSRAALG